MSKKYFLQDGLVFDREMSFVHEFSSPSSLLNPAKKENESDSLAENTQKEISALLLQWYNLY